jgi:hypothetical protein
VPSFSRVDLDAVMSFFAPDAVYDLSDAGLETVKRMKVKRMKGFEPSTFAMARRGKLPEARR